MELLSLACGHCGAPLEVPDGTRFVTCGYCSSKLEVHRSGGAIYTEVLEALQKRTEEIAGDVEILKLQNELERIDREWQSTRESCMIRGKDGGLSEPSPVAGTIAGVIAIGFGIGWIVVAASMIPADGSVRAGFHRHHHFQHLQQSQKVERIRREKTRTRTAPRGSAASDPEIGKRAVVKSASDHENDRTGCIYALR